MLFRVAVACFLVGQPEQYDDVHGAMFMWASSSIVVYLFFRRRRRRRRRITRKACVKIVPSPNEEWLSRPFY